jgi:hypothetical protein
MHRLFALLLLAGCTPTTFAFSPTVSVTAKPDNCPVEVMTSLPSRGYQEIGTLDFHNGTEPRTLDAFKKAVSKRVCEVGGDAVVAIADDKGQFTKGTVIAYTGPATSPRPDSTPEQQTDNELPKPR